MARFVVAVTGGIASGKTAATDAFKSLGVAVADADSAARAIVEPGQPALAEIVARFGTAMLAASGHLQRRALRERIFSDATGKRDLEAIMHPRIRARLHAECEAARGDYVVVAIPLLAEVGARAAYPWLKRVLVVDVPEGIQLARLVDRDHISGSLAENMIANQASRAQRLAMADDVLTNDGPLAFVENVVATLHQRYRAMAARDP